MASSISSERRPGRTNTGLERSSPEVRKRPVSTAIRSVACNSGNRMPSSRSTVHRSSAVSITSATRPALRSRRIWESSTTSARIVTRAFSIPAAAISPSRRAPTPTSARSKMTSPIRIPGCCSNCKAASAPSTKVWTRPARLWMATISRTSTSTQRWPLAKRRPSWSSRVCTAPNRSP